MENKMFLLFILYFGTVIGTDVKIENRWRDDVGWEIDCSWTLYNNDSLQSVRLYGNDQQFMIYRPEIHGKQFAGNFNPDKRSVIRVECNLAASSGREGKCLLTIEFYMPPISDSKYICEVSGERPTFRVQRKDITIQNIVPPTAALIKVTNENSSPTRVVLNCTSSGLPAPTLIWTVGDQKIPNAFSGSTWNVTSKLWHVWSIHSYTLADPLAVTCTPEVSKAGHFLQGVPAEYNSAQRTDTTIAVMFSIVTSTLWIR